MLTTNDAQHHGTWLVVTGKEQTHHAQDLPEQLDAQYPCDDDDDDDDDDAADDADGIGNNFFSSRHDGLKNTEKIYVDMKTKLIKGICRQKEGS